MYSNEFQRELLLAFIQNQLLPRVHLQIFRYSNDYLVRTMEHIENADIFGAKNIEQIFLYTADVGFEVMSKDELPLEYAKLRLFLDYLFILKTQNFQLTADGSNLMTQFLEKPLLTGISDNDPNKNQLQQFSTQLINSLGWEPGKSRTDFFLVIFGNVLDCMKNRADAGEGN